MSRVYFQNPISTQPDRGAPPHDITPPTSKLGSKEILWILCSYPYPPLAPWLRVCRLGPRRSVSLCHPQSLDRLGPSCFQHAHNKHELRALSLGETGRHPIWPNSRRVGRGSRGQQRSCWNAGSGGAREGDGLWARFRSTGRQHYPPIRCSIPSTWTSFSNLNRCTRAESVSIRIISRMSILHLGHM